MLTVLPQSHELDQGVLPLRGEMEREGKEGEEKGRKGNVGGERERKREDRRGVLNLPLKYICHLRGRAWEVFPIESWRDVSVGMRLQQGLARMLSWAPL